MREMYQELYLRIIEGSTVERVRSLAVDALLLAALLLTSSWMVHPK
ncbi:MAG TPA: hypothetical protein VKB88_15345 [Bryobacteraceae bacterium]|nr:hypothetical protein [Bryobacteraceae bacterium]